MFVLVLCQMRAWLAYSKQKPNPTDGSPKYVELCQFTLLFCRERQRNVPRFKTHVHSHCFAH